MPNLDSATSTPAKKETAKKREVTTPPSIEEAFAPQSTSSLAALQRAVADPRTARPADILALQRRYGNQAVQRLLASHTIQAKLTVGAANDPYEQEADRVAAQVMAAPDPMPAVQRFEEEEEIQTKPLAATLLTAPPAAATITPLVRRAFEDEELQAKPLGQHQTALLAQSQTKATNPVHLAAQAQVIQRHSSWEHKMLGDIPPGEISKIGYWKDLLKQTELTGIYGFRKPQQQEALVQVGDLQIKKGDVLHVLVQEMQRLNQWQAKPPTGTSAADQQQVLGPDAEWGVVLVSLPSPGGKPSLVVTYGELNTLADYYGSVDVMKTADPKNRLQIVQSVRKETFLRLKDIYEQVQASLTSAEKQDAQVKAAQVTYKKGKLAKTSFAGAMRPDYISGKAGQADLLAGDKPLIGQGTGARGETNKYGATLARNACHFAPESWHAWASYHAKARALAVQAHTATAEADRLQLAYDREDFSRRPLDQNDAQLAIRLKRHEAAQLANEALLNNGFGDHYLQDSYASGHMLNKTQIMQWYVEYIDQNKEWDYFRDENWRKVQAMAYRQPGLAAALQYDKARVRGVGDNPSQPRNPQAVEDIAGDDWQVRFAALGLQVPASLRTPGSPERQLMEWWQLGTGNKAVSRELMGAELRAKCPFKGGNLRNLRPALKNLIADGIVRTTEEVERRGAMMSWSGAEMSSATFTHFDDTQFVLRENYIPKDMAKFTAALSKSRGSADTPGNDADYQRMAASVSYGDYFEFMQSGFIQKSTNALHDVFCAGGLEVSSGADEAVFMVYGDDAMFNQGSAPGVQHSAETANKSRDAILNLTNTGADAGITTASIVSRLPAYVKPKGQAKTSLQNWHNPANAASLKAYCFSEVFPGMSWSAMQKLVPGVGGSELGLISQDKKIHGADAF